MAANQHGPVDPKVVGVMNEVGQLLGEAFEGYGFTLLVFDWDHVGRMNYMSNAKREDMLTALKELVANMEGRGHKSPRTKQ